MNFTTVDNIESKFDLFTLPHTELYFDKVVILDECIRSLFTNPVTMYCKLWLLRTYTYKGFEQNVI